MDSIFEGENYIRVEFNRNGDDREIPVDSIRLREAKQYLIKKYLYRLDMTSEDHALPVYDATSSKNYNVYLERCFRYIQAIMEYRIVGDRTKLTEYYDRYRIPPVHRIHFE